MLFLRQICSEVGTWPDSHVKHYATLVVDAKFWKPHGNFRGFNTSDCLQASTWSDVVLSAATVHSC
jgi:hypothetical protein